MATGAAAALAVRREGSRCGGSCCRSPAHAAVTISGSTVDAAGNYVATATSRSTGSSTRTATARSSRTRVGSFDAAGSAPRAAPSISPWLEDGIRWSSSPISGYRRAPATRVLPRQGRLRVRRRDHRRRCRTDLPAWTIDAIPTVTGTVATTDGRPVRGATVTAYAADDGDALAKDPTSASGAFRVGVQEGVKLPVLRLRPRDRQGAGHGVLLRQGRPRQRRRRHARRQRGHRHPRTRRLDLRSRHQRRRRAPLPCDACTSGNCDFSDANDGYTIEGDSTGANVVEFSDPIDEYLPEYFNNVAVDEVGDPVSAPTVVTVGPGPAVTGINAGLAAKSKPALTGVDLSGVVRDQLGGIGVGYEVSAYDTPANPRDAQGRRQDDLQPLGWLRLHHARPHRWRDRVQDRGRG